MSNDDDIANKRIALTPATWYSLSEMNRPGQTFSELIDEMMENVRKGKKEQE